METKTVEQKDLDAAQKRIDDAVADLVTRSVVARITGLVPTARRIAACGGKPKPH